MKKFFLFISLLIFCGYLYLPSQAWSYPYSDIYVFGDSLSDTGRFFEATGLPPAPYFEGRLSNGKVWVEHLAFFLGLTYNPQTNFAWADATTGTTNGWSEDFPGLQQQIDTYIEPTDAAVADALYVVWAGPNDFLDGVTNLDEAITTAVTNIVTAVTKLRQHGALHILVPNLPDLGKSPRSLADGNSVAMTELSLAYNQALANALQSLEVTQVDMPTSLEILTDSKSIVDPTFVTLTNFTEACLNLKSFSLCDTPDNYFYWDDLHPTTVGHKLIALFFYAAVAEPTYELSDEPLLKLPVVEVISDAGKQFIFDVWLFDYFSNSGLVLVVNGNTLQIAKPLGDMITLPNGYQYPTFEESTGILHLPIVHLIEPNIGSDGSFDWEFLVKYRADFTLMPNTLGYPFKAPLFELTEAVLLAD
ncbi:MAG: hypothetical protein DRR19_02400 [Candidatus Parabeggiatoa sp. nov. 1]|nr:MAG: hypothetical protein DRR19_02400 [Gammaproteobacteria bacterium]